MGFCWYFSYFFGFSVIDIWRAIFVQSSSPQSPGIKANGQRGCYVLNPLCMCRYVNIHHSKGQKINGSYFSDNFLHHFVAPSSFSGWRFPLEFRLHNHIDCRKGHLTRSCVFVGVALWSKPILKLSHCSIGQTNKWQVAMEIIRKINLFKLPTSSLFISNKEEPVQTTSTKICILGWIWKYMQESVGICINCCKHIFL